MISLFLTEQVEHCRRIGGWIHYLLLESVTLCMTTGMTTNHLNSQPPENITIHSEQDIIGQQASVVYHKYLQELAEYLVIPIRNCVSKDPDTKQWCGAPRPFEMKINTRGTSATVVWVSTTKSQCRPLHSWSTWIKRQAFCTK